MALVWAWAHWEEAEARQHAQNVTTQGAGAAEGYVKFNSKGVTKGKNGVSSIGVWEVHSRKMGGGTAAPPANRSSTPSGGGAGKSRASGPQALEATSANQQAITNGGAGFDIGASQIGSDLPVRDDEWKGVDSYTPDNKVNSFAPRTNNWDSFRRVGSRSIRAGVAKLADDRDTVNDGSTASATVTVVTKANFAASTDYIVFKKANGDTHAFWFDTTGADSTPGGATAADARTQVNISGDTSAADVSDALTTAINSASIGITATDNGGTVGLAIASSGYLWRVFEYVTNAGFLAPQFTIAGSALSSEYRGMSLCALNASGPDNADQLLLSFIDKDVEIGDAPGGSNSLTSLHVVDTGPRWGRPRDLTGLPGPTLALSDQGSQVLRVTAIYDTIPTAQAELREQSVKAITIRIVGPVSGATPRFPLDPDGSDGTGSVPYVISGPANVTRRTWDGSSTNFDMTLTTAAGYGAGKYWVAAFAHSLDGTSEPSFGSLTIA